MLKVRDVVGGKFGVRAHRRIAGQHGHFTMENYRKWLKKAETDDFARALRRLAQLNQSKVYLFWKRSRAQGLNVCTFCYASRITYDKVDYIHREN